MRARESAWSFACLTIVALLSVSACSEDNLPPKADDDDTTTEEGAATGDDDEEPADDVAGDDDGPSSNMDAGRKDGGSGTLDAGRKDGGAADASRADAGRADGGRADAAPPINGIDGGTQPDAGGVMSPVDEPAVISGCGATKLYETNADDTGVLGPWPAGVKTLKVPVGSSALTVEVWYPAKLGSEAGKSKEAYDLRTWLPTGATKIPDSVNKLAVCNCYRDLPLDTEHGPYPAVLFIHGLGSMRVGSMSAMALWASRGFVVVAADHPGDMLTDFLASFGALSGCSSSTPAGGDMASEANTVLTALKGKTAGFDFLGDAVDLTRIGLGGHSQGGGTVAGMANTPNVKVIITLAPLGGGALNAPVDSMLQVTGTIDSVTGYSTGAYNSDRSKVRRHVGIKAGGHIDVTDLCKEKNPAGKTAIEVARDEGVCGALILSGLAQCGGDPVATDVAPLIVNYATTAALEETLHCKNRDAAFAAIRTKFPQISEFLHAP